MLTSAQRPSRDRGNSLIRNPGNPRFEPQLSLLLGLALAKQRLLVHTNAVDTNALAESAEDALLFASNDRLEVILASGERINAFLGLLNLDLVALNTLREYSELRVQVFDASRN